MNKKQISSLSFVTTIKKNGNSGHIIVPVSLIGKTVKVSLEVKA